MVFWLTIIFSKTETVEISWTISGTNNPAQHETKCYKKREHEEHNQNADTQYPPQSNLSSWL